MGANGSSANNISMPVPTPSINKRDVVRIIPFSNDNQVSNNNSNSNNMSISSSKTNSNPFSIFSNTAQANNNCNKK